MKTKKRKVKIEIEVQVPTYTANDGTKFEETDEYIIESAKDGVKRAISNIIDKKQLCKDHDTIDKFMSFKPNCKVLYDENNKETYINFVNHYLKKYYVDSDNSNHMINGGNWEHSQYNPLDNLDQRMIDKKLYKNEGSVREFILMHLVSGDSVRMYGNPQSYKRVIDLNTTEELKEFFRFILDSKMFDVNEKFVMPQGFKESKCGWWYLEAVSERYSSIAELLILECWRNNQNIEVVKWLIDEYGMDLHKVNQHRILNERQNYSLFPFIVSKLHDSRIHDTYNNGVLRRLYEYEGTKKTEEGWENKFFDSLIDFTNLIRDNFPLLPIEELREEKIIKFNDLSTWLENSILIEHLESSYKGEVESATLLIENMK